MKRFGGIRDSAPDVTRGRAAPYSSETPGASNVTRTWLHQEGGQVERGNSIMEQAVIAMLEEQATVRLENGNLVVDGRWETSALEVVRLFEERADPDDLSPLFDQVVRAGSLAVAAADTSMDVQIIDREFGRLVGRLDEELTSRFGNVARVLDELFRKDGGVLRVALEEYLGDGGSLADMFDPNLRTSAMGKFSALLDAHFDGRDSKLFKLLDHENPASPLSQWHTKLGGQLRELTEKIDGYRLEAATQVAMATGASIERAKGTQKGYDYEDVVFELINECASALGDQVEPTGHECGPSGRKVGDVVVTLSPRDTQGRDVRIVFEAKDRSVGLTPILRELADAMDNRDAVAAVAVFSADDRAPRGTAPFRECTDNRFICVLDPTQSNGSMPLALAYRAARYWAIVDTAGDLSEFDGDAARNDIAAAMAKLRMFSDLKRQLTKVQRGVEQGSAALAAGLDSLQRDLGEVLERLDQRFTATGSDVQ